MTDPFAPLLRSLWTDLQDQRILWQVATIVISLLVASGFSYLVRPRLREIGGTRLEFGLGSLRRLVLPLSALVLVLAGRAVLVHFQPNVSLLNLAIPLLTAMAIITFVVHLQRLVFAPGSLLATFERTIVWIVWIGFALYVLGLAPGILEYFDSVGFRFGGHRISLLLIAQAVIWVMIALLLALWLKRRHTHSFWLYVLGPGALSWAALYWGGFHPALALVPIVPFMPHSPRDLGIFDAREDRLPDTLNRFEHWWATPVQLILMLFGFANAGVPFVQIGPGTYYVLAALLVGKPVGVFVLSMAGRLFGARLPNGVRMGDLVLVGIAASIGFTVSLFFATAAFPGGDALAQTKMGALLSFVAVPLALTSARFIRGDAAKQRAGEHRRLATE